jgi:hypothetical protein
MVGEWKSLAHCVNVMKTGRLPRRLFSIECDGRGRGYTVETVIHFDNRLTKKKKKIKIKIKRGKNNTRVTSLIMGAGAHFYLGI